jgi:ABC-2 type transport system permease protein
MNGDDGRRAGDTPGGGGSDRGGSDRASPKGASALDRFCAAPPIDAVALRRPGGPVTTMGKVVGVLRATVASRFAYLGEMLLRTTFLVLILYTFSQLWATTNRSNNVATITGFTVAQMIWYLVFTEAMITSGAPERDTEVDREVRSGDIAYRLIRPLAYPLYHLGAELGERLPRFVLNLAVGAGVALLVVGPVRLVPLAVGAALVSALLAFLVDFVWRFSISLLSFWIEDTYGLHLLYRRFLMLLGGMLIPLEAYPEKVAAVLRMLPFQYLIYQPARIFVRGDLAAWPRVVLAQLIFAAVGMVPLLFVYRLGLRRVAAQGG